MRESHPSVERRLIWFLAAIAAIAVGGVLAIAPYRLYQRDVRLAQVNAHRIASLVHVALAERLQRGSDVRDVAHLVNHFEAIAALEIRLRQLSEDETPPGGSEGKGSSERHDTDLTYTAPPILDDDGHTWVATMHFDLSPMKRESVRLIQDLVVAVLLGSSAFSLAVFLLIRRALLQPLHEVTHRVERFADGQDMGPLPAYESQELASLMHALERARQLKTGA